jgi:hypothetical protein
VDRAALAQKYRLMAELRRAGAPDERAEDRARLRALADEFPGALRELDTLTSEEIDERARACERGEDAPWMDWMAAYHAHMRAALELRRPDADFAAIAARTGVTVDDDFIAQVANPPHGRLMVTVFDRLASLFGVERRAIWDALFPPRKGPRPYR